MGMFTIPLCEVIEMEGEDNIGLNEYPIFDEAHRAVLNKKIIEHYFNQEIGQETISMFRLAMKRRMNEIMPQYNQHYILSKIELDALSTVNIETESTNAAQSTGVSSGTNTSSTDSKSSAVSSNFPQVKIEPDGYYATAAQDNTSVSAAEGESKETQTGNQNASASGFTKGYQGHQPELIFAARQTIVNIDLDIINELGTLFMGVWSVPIEYTRARTHIEYPYY